MPDDPVIAALDEIRQRDKAVAMGHVRDPEDVPRLLAAVEAVLELTRDTDGDDLPGSSEVPVGEFQVAITDALLGKEESDNAGT